MRPHCHFHAAHLFLMLPLLALSHLTGASPSSPRAEQELRIFYHRVCATCHGEDGSAISPTGKKLKGVDFTAEKSMSRVSDKVLVKAIQNGVFFGMDMPAYKGDLTEEETQIMVRNILRKARRGEPILTQTQASESKLVQGIPPSGTR